MVNKKPAKEYLQAYEVLINLINYYFSNDRPAQMADQELMMQLLPPYYLVRI
jgi:hypothetical protein